MKFMSFEDPQGRQGLGVTDGTSGVIQLRTVLGQDFQDMNSFISLCTDGQIEALKKAIERGAWDYSLSELRLLPPIPRPLHDVLCVGVNYQDHLDESKGQDSSLHQDHQTVYFTKRAIRILGDGEAIPSRLDLDEKLDYEVELAVILGRGGRDITEEEAEGHIFGYSVFNDLSSRGLQFRHVQWFRGKSLDGYTAMGPWILHRSALPFPVKVDVISRVNGEERQHSNTKMFLTPLAKIIAQLSQGMTLEAGDIIATGTPAGVAMGFNPPRFLKKGDTVSCEIPQIGTLNNVVA